jgi:hypothetical protein
VPSMETDVSPIDKREIVNLRRTFLKKASVLAPTVCCVAAFPAFAMHRSPKPDPWDDGKASRKEKDARTVAMRGERRRRVRPQAR